jgi:hypothetical protein
MEKVYYNKRKGKVKVKFKNKMKNNYKNQSRKWHNLTTLKKVKNK